MGCIVGTPANVEKSGAEYAHIRSRIQTFDLLLFRGYDPVSDCIAAVQSCFVGPGGSEYTHLGLAIRGSDLPGVEGVSPTGLYVWESTMSGPLGDGVNNVFGDAFLGVQLRDLDEVVPAYDSHPDTRLAWAPLRPEVRAGIASRHGAPMGMSPGATVLAELFEEKNGTPYDVACCALAGAAGSCCRPLRSLERRLCPATQDWIFCSELVCLTYQALGAIAPEANPMDAMPADFIPRAFADDTAGLTTPGRTAPVNGGSSADGTRATAPLKGDVAGDTECVRIQFEDFSCGTLDTVSMTEIESVTEIESMTEIEENAEHTEHSTLDADGEIPRLVDAPIRFTAFPPPPPSTPGGPTPGGPPLAGSI